MSDQIQSDATAIFLYSPSQERIRDGGRLPRSVFVGPDGSKTAYTKEVASGSNSEADIAAYQKEFPDAHVAGYGTADTRRLFSAPPTLAFAAPR